MRIANVKIKVYRKPDCVDKFGVAKKNCQYEQVAEIMCAKTYKTGNTAQQAEEARENLEYLNFLWHSTDQEEFVNIEKNDYFAFTVGGEDRFYLIRRAEGRSAFRYGKGKELISFRANGERKVPRECPKEIMSQYGSDDLLPSIPSA